MAFPRAQGQQFAPSRRLRGIDTPQACFFGPGSDVTRALPTGPPCRPLALVALMLGCGECMAYRPACELPERIAAAVSIAGAGFYGAARNPSAP